MKPPKRVKKSKAIKAWADVGSHGGIFFFADGPVAKRYPNLMHVYRTKVSPDLHPILIQIIEK